MNNEIHTAETNVVETKKRLTLFQKIVAGFLALVFLFLFYITLDANKYRATVLVIEGEGKVGVNPTTERLDFGDLSPGGRAVRTVSIENGTFLPVYVFALPLGSITDIMTLDKNAFVVGAHTSDKIEFSVYMPASAPVGQHLNGRVYLFKIPF
jgi:hypothetical protein